EAPGRGVAAECLGLIRWRVAWHRRVTNGDHRGRCGANLKHRARDAWDLADLRHLKDFDKPRCREASRPVGPSGPRRPARPRFFSGRAANKTAGGPGACSKVRAAERWLFDK